MVFHLVRIRTNTSLASRFFDLQSWDTTELVALNERQQFSQGLSQYYAHIVTLFDRQKEHTYVADFAKLALQHHKLEVEFVSHENDEATAAFHSDLQTRLFTALLHASQYNDAYNALSEMRNPSLRRSSLSSFFSNLISSDRAEECIDLAYLNFDSNEVDSVFDGLARKSLSVAAPKYYAVLYSFRLLRSNYRGAAQAAFERLRRLQKTDDSAAVQTAYVLLINTLSIVREREAWIAVDPLMTDGFSQAAAAMRFGHGRYAAQKGKHGILTLEDVRRLYQAELDRVADAQRGRFPFAAEVGSAVEDADAMDVL